jgi:hypothetical protein
VLQFRLCGICPPNIPTLTSQFDLLARVAASRFRLALLKIRLLGSRIPCLPWRG